MWLVEVVCGSGRKPLLGMSNGSIERRTVGCIRVIVISMLEQKLVDRSVKFSYIPRV